MKIKPDSLVLTLDETGREKRKDTLTDKSINTFKVDLYIVNHNIGSITPFQRTRTRIYFVLKRYSYTSGLLPDPLFFFRPTFSSQITRKFAYSNLFFIGQLLSYFLGFPCGSTGKEYTCNARDLGSIHGLGRSPGKGNGNPLQYSCLENSMDRGAWTKSRTGLSDPTYVGFFSLENSIE